MRTGFAASLFLSVLLGSGASAHEAKVIHLDRAVIACEGKADLRDFPADMRKINFLAEMPLPYRQGRCIRLAPGSARIEKVQGTYACLRQLRHSCLWVRSEDAGVPMIGDFPEIPARGAPKVRHAAPGERPAFTPEPEDSPNDSGPVAPSR